MMDISGRLANLGPAIEKIIKIGGTAGASLGVLFEGKPIHYANFGFRDVENKLPPDENTIFPACSLTKALTSAGIARLVEDQRLGWDSLVKDVLPDFTIRDQLLHEHMTICDLLCHRTGMSRGDNICLGSNSNILIPGKDSLDYLANQKGILSFRGQFKYNNLPYEIADHVISETTGAPWSDLLVSEILEPIGLRRTSFKTSAADIGNIAKCYNTLDDGTPIEIPCVKAGNDLFGGPSGGLRTCVNDLLKLYKTFLSSFNDQFSKGTTTTKDSPLKQFTNLTSARVPMNAPTKEEESYAFGWVRVQLPGSMGKIGCNPALMPQGMPIVGKGGSFKLVLYHQGSFPGALAAVVLVPGIEAAVVVLTNSLALNDTADWIAQLVLEELLDTPDRNDYVKAAETSVAENAKWYTSTIKELEAEKKDNASARPLQEYVGIYWDDIEVFKIVVSLEDEGLYWAFQGLDSEKYPLTHYKADVFTWIQPRNALSRRGLEG